MLPYTEHLGKARRNEMFANNLNRQDRTQREWTVIAAFYSAVHYVNAYFAFHNITISDHDSRASQVRKCLREIEVPYGKLAGLGYEARYYNPDVRHADVEARLRDLQSIRQHVESLLARQQ